MNSKTCYRGFSPQNKPNIKPSKHTFLWSVSALSCLQSNQDPLHNPRLYSNCKLTTDHGAPARYSSGSRHWYVCRYVDIYWEMLTAARPRCYWSLLTPPLQIHGVGEPHWGISWAGAEEVRLLSTSSHLTLQHHGDTQHGQAAADDE